ncbi:enoyl-CoA hydratase-related protein [Alkalibacillus haloalkaliphilus]|uniref:enoyl-CoA hydratase-related protein n=1 Tax=Alkalibacillus haloalkaliphilus TaxID=94136 RepID=UPI0029360D07|nr:enoyl-CoA hydratase-related protein [Alkalibacillus haloalkaliphilus]MDV2580723.1 enoyl-CoA hydratase-related protein [Alkalibacillus haloalkaliphilus]
MSTVQFEMIDDYIGKLTLNRPEAANAFSKQLMQDFNEQLDAIEQHETLRALIITANGEKAFCAGADLKERRTMTQDQVVETVGQIGSLVTRVANLKAPTIAAINGATFGGGLELTLGCDIRIASTNAKMGLTETSLAIIPGAGGTQRLARLIGLAKAKYYILTAKRFDSYEGERIGLIEKVVDLSELQDEALEIANQIASNGPVGVQMAKQAIDEGLDHDIETGLKLEREKYLNTIPTKDRLEALEAFKEKRKPIFTGK